MTKPKSPPAEFDDILAQEYHYVAQSAAQANEDRARVSSFYMIAVGSLVAAIFSTQFFDPGFFTVAIKLMFSGLFALLTLLGSSTIIQLARLRAAWYDAMLAMNQIKDFVLRRKKELVGAFRWRSNTLPTKFKIDSISYFQAREAAILSGLTFAASIFFAQFALDWNTWVNWLASALGGIIIIRVQLALYKRTLK